MKFFVDIYPYTPYPKDMKNNHEKADRQCRGTVFNIQKFSVNDGPGIRTVVFMKGCPLHCAWCANPESQSARPQILWDKRKCIHCQQCTENCHLSAISFHEDHFHVDDTICDSCSLCVRECPAAALKKEGERNTVQEVLNIVEQDRAFYEESGGGITLSGGELLMQPRFAENLLKAAHENGLHTACETTGFAQKDTFAKIMKHVDWIYMDLKHWDPHKHKEGTGVFNEIIIENMKYAIDQGYDVHVRIPVIPGFNDTIEDAGHFAETLRKAGTDEVQLLPFHQFGENKYDMLDCSYAYGNKKAYHPEDLEEYRKAFEKFGVHAFF